MKVTNNANIGGLMQQQLKSSNAVSAQKMKQIASGRRINSAADDASGLSIAKKLEALSRGIGAASQNTQDAVSMIRTADGALSGVSDMTSRMSELASRASSGTLNDEQRGALQEEYDQLAQEIDRVGQSTNFNGNKLFDGSTYTMQVGAESGDRMDITMDEMSTAALGLGNVDLTTAGGAANAMGAIKNASEQLSSQRGTLAAAESGLQSVFNNLQNSDENIISSVSRIMDQDIGAASISKNISDALSQSAVALQKNSQNMVPYTTLQMLLK